MQCFLYLHHAKHCEAKCGCPTCARPQSAGDREGQGTVAQDSTFPTAVDGMWPVPCHISWDSVSPPPWVVVPSSLSPGLSLGPAATLSDMGQDAQGGHGSCAAHRPLPAVISTGATKPHHFCSEGWAVMEAAVRGTPRALFDAE